MFAPYCAHCGSRVLLGPRRIVRLCSSESGPIGAVLRCFCGAEVDADATAPKASIPAPPLPAEVDEPHEVCV
jgi:hypothetical protein